MIYAQGAMADKEPAADILYFLIDQALDEALPKRGGATRLFHRRRHQTSIEEMPASGEESSEILLQRQARQGKQSRSTTLIAATGSRWL
jgi:hypothetical protein